MRMKQFVVVILVCSFWTVLAMAKDLGTTDRGSRTPGAKGQPEGQTIELTVGQTHTVTLESNPTTGYRWQLAAPPDQGILTLVGSEYKKPESKLIGAGGHESWTFRAVGTGKTRIVMIYVRPWEDGKAARMASFNVIVK
jgi:inhibitor of cysteine peptidase